MFRRKHELRTYGIDMAFIEGFHWTLDDELPVNNGRCVDGAEEGLEGRVEVRYFERLAVYSLKAPERILCIAAAV